VRTLAVVAPLPTGGTYTLRLREGAGAPPEILRDGGAAPADRPDGRPPGGARPSTPRA
jgi:hypothetical protein